MRRNQLHLFVNPTAGRGRTRKRLPRIQALLAEAGLDVCVNASNSVGDLEARVCEYVGSGGTRAIIVGGDGSMHEATNAVLRSNPEAAIGLIPCGTGNDFAKAAGIPLDWQTATKLLAERIASDVPPRVVDAGRMNDRFFANGAGIGFDAKVNMIARAFRWPIGDLVYLAAILRALVDGVTTAELRIDSDGLEYSGRLTLASISNGPYVGGMFHIAPPAKNTDGRLDLLIVDPVSRRRVLALVPRLIRGRHMNAPEIRHARVRRVVIDADGDLPSHLDGEVQPLKRHFEIEILPGSLRLA